MIKKIIVTVQTYNDEDNVLRIPVFVDSNASKAKQDVAILEEIVYRLRVKIESETDLE